MFFQTYNGRVHAVAEIESRYAYGWTRCGLYIDSRKHTLAPDHPTHSTWGGFAVGLPVNCLACLAKDG